MTKGKVMPQDLRIMIKHRRFKNIRELQAFCKKHNFPVSLGWLSVHKDQWTPSEDEVEITFDEDDETFDTDLATRMLMFKGLKVKKISEKIHFSSAQLASFTRRSSEGCTAFAKYCLVWMGKPILLQKYQKDMIDGWLGTKPTMYPIGRGGGKDFTLSIFLIWIAICFPNTRIMVVCPAYRQVRTFINENLYLMLQTSSALNDSIENKIEEELLFTNGSIIFTYGATSFIKGKHNLHFVFANEGAEIPDHVYENVLLPMLGSEGVRGHFGIMGVPGGQQGFFWRAYQRGSPEYDDTGEYYCIHLPTEVNKFYPKDQLDLNRRLMSHDSYLQEHMARFLRVEDALFTDAILEKMKEEYETSYATVDHKHFEYYLGIDWGRTAAYSVMTIISKNLKTGDLKLVYIKSFKWDFSKQIEWVKTTEVIYKFKTIMSEYMGLGIPPSDILRKEIGSKVKFFTPSPASWFEVFTNLRDDADNERLVIPAGELRLLGQLRLMQFVMRANRLTVRSEGKDDFAQSFGMAHYGIKRSSGSGVAGSL